MHPILFQIGQFSVFNQPIGPFFVYSYGAMVAVAIVVCAVLLSRDGAQRGISGEMVYDLVFGVVLGGLLGARIFYVFLTWDYFSQNLMEIVMIHRGGLAWQGGFCGGALAGAWFAFRRKFSLRILLDLAAPYIALGQAIGRLGCFFNGCCYGKPWEEGVFFPVHDARLHPTQLYEAAALFLIFILLKFFQRQAHPAGMAFVLYVWLAALERFTVEFTRADHDLLAFGLSLAQYISIGIFAIGTITYLRLRK